MQESVGDNVFPIFDKDRLQTSADHRLSPLENMDEVGMRIALLGGCTG